MLFSCLKRQNIGVFSFSVNGFSCDSSRELTFIGVFACDKSAVRPSEVQRKSQRLKIPDRNIAFWRFKKRKRGNIRAGNNKFIRIFFGYINYLTRVVGCLAEFAG